MGWLWFFLWFHSEFTQMLGPCACGRKVARQKRSCPRQVFVTVYESFRTVSTFFNIFLFTSIRTFQSQLIRYSFFTYLKTFNIFNLFLFISGFGASHASHGSRPLMASAAKSLGAVQGFGHPGGAQPEGAGETKFSRWSVPKKTSRKWKIIKASQNLWIIWRIVLSWEKPGERV